MIRLDTDTPDLYGDICEVIRLFMPDARIRIDDGEAVMTHRHAETHGEWIETWTFEGQSVTHAASRAFGGLLEKRELKRAVKTGCFLLLSDLTGENPPWGSLTGIRPTRLYYEALEKGLSPEHAERWLRDTFFVSPEKVSLLAEIVGMQRGLIEREADEFDLYIGIPFCVTRCSYCSFASDEIGDGRLVAPYVDALLTELKNCAELTREMGLRLRALYVGGGTPTAIPIQKLRLVLDAARESFPGARETTVEAGRPDTITRDMLAMLKSGGVTRISVNPQSFKDETLRKIGRSHTAKDTLFAYHLAREMGFTDINMDVIAALPGETPDDFRRTIETAVELSPDSLTVHTLALKRSSKLHETGGYEADAASAQSMVDRARGLLTSGGYMPYYLYRQKYMAGNLENVGYAKPGKACLYNIDNMEETTPVLALGAGAITKWLFPRERRIERAPNVKNVEQYIHRVNEMVARKRTLLNPA